MRIQQPIWTTLLFVLAVASQPCRAGDKDKVYEVGKDGLKITGELGKVSAITYKVKLEAGKTYAIDMISPDQKALDPFLRLLDANGKRLAEDDDGGEGLNARIIYMGGNTAVYSIVATCFGKGRGAFTLTIRETEKGEAGKLAKIAKAKQLNEQAVALYREGKVQEAVELSQEALTIRKEVLGERHPDYAQTLNNLAFLYKEQGIIGKAEPLYLKALKIRKEVLGEKHPDYAISLNNLATLYHGQGDFGKAEPLYLKALKIRKEVLGEKHPDYAQSLNNLAFLYKEQGILAKAEPLYLKALAIRKEVLGERHPDYAQSLDNLAALYEEQGNYSKAESLYVNVLEIRKEVQGEKHPDYAISLNNLAFLCYAQWNFAKAEPLYVKAMEIRKEVLGEKHPDYAISLNNLAALYERQGNDTKAETLYFKSLEIREEVLGEKHPDYARGLNNLAGLYYGQGNYAKAEPLFLKSLKITKEVLGEKHPDYARSLNNLARLYDGQGNDIKAEPLYVKAMEIRKEVLGEKHPDYAISLNNLALFYDGQGNYAKAEPLNVLALNILKEVLGEKHPDYALSLNNLAFLYDEQGNYAKAEPLYLKAMEIRKEVLGGKHPDYAQSLSNLAGLYYRQRNYAKAEPFYLKALTASQISKSPVPIDDLTIDKVRIHQDTVIILASYAGCLQESAKSMATSLHWRSCDRYFLLALSVQDRILRHKVQHSQDKIQMTADEYYLFPGRIKTLHTLFSLEQKTKDLEAAFWTSEQGRARAFLESLGKTRANILVGISLHLQNQEKRLREDINLLDLRIHKESARPLDLRNPDVIGQLHERRRNADEKLKQLSTEMEKEYPQYAGLKYPRPCKLEEAAACLAPDEVALLFVPGTDESYIVLVEARPKPGDKANGLAIIELSGAATLAEHVAGLIDSETLGLPARARLLGRLTFDALLGPCKDRIKNRNLVIVPNDSLCFLPFELLVEEDGKYLVENHRIRYAPSLTVLHFINLWKQKRAAPEVPLFAVGDPLYEREFQRLEHSGYEVAEIAKKLGAKREFVLTRGKACNAEIKKLSDGNTMAKARYIHFATHGILGLDRGKQPALVLSQSGKDIEESFLQMDEITSLKLNADLVVLSACKSGQGRLHQGEGVTGLARAFLYAGSKGVVCSLWSVDDRETSNLMIDFYGHLQKGRSAPDALRESQLAMIRAGKAQPLYWAPFVLIGE